MILKELHTSLRVQSLQSSESRIFLEKRKLKSLLHHSLIQVLNVVVMKTALHELSHLGK